MVAEAGHSSADGNQGPVRLKREVGLLGGIALIVGTVIGSGIFISPGGVLESSGSVGAGMIVWLGSGIIAFMGKLKYSEVHGTSL
jgi:amino acid permease